MKRKILIMFLFLSTLAICSCGGSQQINSAETAVESEIDETSDNISTPPNLSQIRSICELATLECYFHNVAKSEKKAGTGISHLGEKDRTFWIEYTGVAKIGINMSKVKMEIEDTTITVTLPQAELQAYKVETILESNYIASEDSWNRNPITAEEQTAAVQQAQQDMISNIKNDSMLLVRAQDRAKKLIENYIVKLGQASDTKYKIIWAYEE